ncbi:hypothetical protein [uncultured Rhodoblastus sp.]|uniref:hypothetical protein n=1 Tax=uncultured Rhodoblastus sp. TaxID=543037 RepID=UPI0025D68C87|nr:hypothetical protein [uncultured Rhodoblastus sp.]
MNDNYPPALWIDRAIGLGAALASALLFAASTRGSSLAMTLAYFAPLPLSIGALGFSPSGALAGALIGAALLAHFTAPALGLGFFLGFGAPALIAAALARRTLPPRGDEASPAPRNLAPGGLLAILMALAVALTWLGVGALVSVQGGFEPAMAAALAHFAAPLDEIVKNVKAIWPDIEADKAKRLFILCLPAGFAASQTVLLAVNLWLAARTVEISGKLGRPWPALPEHLVLPRFVAPLFVLAAGLTLGGGLAGALAGALAAAAGCCLAIQGLAALHAFTRASRFRGFLLSGLYAVVFVLEPWSLLALTLFGLVESVFSLRARKAHRLNPKTQVQKEPR